MTHLAISTHVMNLLRKRIFIMPMHTPAEQRMLINTTIEWIDARRAMGLSDSSIRYEFMRTRNDPLVCGDDFCRGCECRAAVVARLVDACLCLKPRYWEEEA